MRCSNCQEETNPTLIYCHSCGVPLELDIEAIAEDEDRKLEESKRIEATQKAKDLLVLALFLFAVTVAARVVLLKEQRYDHFVSYRAPYKLIEEAGIDPPMALKSDPMIIPIPDYEGD